MEDYKSQFVEMHKKLDILIELLPKWFRSDKIEPPDLVVFPSAQVANDVFQVFDEMPNLSSVDPNEESSANNVYMPSIDELVEGFEQQSPMKLEDLEVADNLFDESPSPPSIGLFEKYFKANDSGSKSYFSNDAENVDQIIWKEGTSLLLDKNSYGVPHNVLENETSKMLDKITAFTIDINVLCLAERTELGKCKGENPIIFAGNDVMFYFDPGGFILPQSFRTNLIDRLVIMNYGHHSRLFSAYVVNTSEVTSSMVTPLGQNFVEVDAHMMFDEIVVSMFDPGIGYWPLIGYDSICSHEMRNNSVVDLWIGNMILCFDPGVNTFVLGTWILRKTLYTIRDRLFDDTGVVANYISSYDTNALKAINRFPMKRTYTGRFDRFDVSQKMLEDYSNFALLIPIYLTRNGLHLCDLVMPLSQFIHIIQWPLISIKDHDTSQASSLFMQTTFVMYYLLGVCENEFPCYWKLSSSYDVVFLIMVVLSQNAFLLCILEGKDCFEGVEKKILGMVIMRSIKYEQTDGKCGLNTACKPLRHLLFLSAFFTHRKLFFLYSIVAETGNKLPTTKMDILDIVAESIVVAYKLKFVSSSSIGQVENATMIGAGKSKKVMEPNFSIISRLGCNMCLDDLLGCEVVCGNGCEELCVEAMDETIENSLKLFVEVCDKQGNVQFMLMIWEVWYKICTLFDFRCFLSMGELCHVPSTPNFNSHGNKNYLGMVENMYVPDCNVSYVIPTCFGDTHSFCLVECSMNPVTTPLYFDEAWLLVRPGNYDMPKSLVEWSKATFFWFEVSFRFDHVAIQLAQMLELVEYDGYSYDHVQEAENGDIVFAIDRYLYFQLGYVFVTTPIKIMIINYASLRVWKCHLDGRKAWVLSVTTKMESFI